MNIRKLLLKLECRGVPTYMVRLLSNELIGKYTFVRWGPTHSELFQIGNGVKQGGILSSLLFNIYMDNLQLHRQPIGYSVGSTVRNHMLYADNIVLCDPSAEGLQTLSDISHTYGCNHDNEFNTSKFGVIYIDSRRKAGNAKSMTIGVTFESCYLFLIPWTYIICVILLISACRCLQTAGRNYCSRLRRCLKLFVSTESTSSHEFVSQFGLAICLYAKEHPKTREYRVACACVYLNEPSTGH